MPTIKDFTKTKQPVALIFGVRTPIASTIIDIFLEEDSKVIVVDNINQSTKTIINKYTKNKNFMFINANTFNKHLEAFMRIDYVYVFLHHVIQGSSFPKIFKTKLNYVSLTHQDFVYFSNLVDTFIKLAIEYASKISITLPYNIGTFIAPLSNYNIKLYNYIKDLFFDLYNQTPFNGRLIYVPELIGKNFDYSLASIANFLYRQTVLSPVIKVPGDGLIKLSFIDTFDASKAILLASFSKKTIGQQLILDHTELTILNFLYTTLEITKNEKKIEFIKLPKEIKNNIQKAQKLFPTHAITSKDIGYRNSADIANSIHDSLLTTNQLLQGEWQGTKNTSPTKIKINTTQRTKEILPHFGEKYKTFESPVEKTFWYVLWTLFNTFIKKPIDFIYNLLAESDKETKNRAFKTFGLILITYLVAIIITPYILLFNSLNQLNNAQNPDKLNTTLVAIEKNLYNITYLNKLGLQEQLTYMQQILKTYQQALQYYKSANQLSEQFSKFLDNIHDPTKTQEQKEYLQHIVTSPYQVTNIINTLKLFNTEIENLTPKYSSIFEQKILSQKPVISNLLQEQIAQLNDISVIYPYIPSIAGYNQEHKIALLLVDDTKPSFIGGYPLGFLTITLKDGTIPNFSYTSLNKSYRDSIFNDTNYQSILLKIKQNIPTSNTIGVLKASQLIKLNTIINNIYIPEYGKIEAKDLPNIINNFATFTKLPYTEKQLITSLFTELLKTNSNKKQEFLTDLLKSTNQNVYFLQSKQDLSDILDASGMLISKSQKDTITIIPYDQTKILNTSFSQVNKQLDIIIDNTTQKITINYKYETPVPYNAYSKFIITGPVTKLNLPESANVNLPYITLNINLSGNASTVGFIQFAFNNASKLQIINPLGQQKILIHVENPSENQKNSLITIGNFQSKIQNTEIYSIDKQIFTIPLN